MAFEIAVIFDMDGVLVDSYDAHWKSWQVLASEVGVTMTQSQFAATFGKTSREVLRSLWGPGKFSDAEIARFDMRKEEVFREIIAAEFPPMPGAMDLLRVLAKSGFGLAVGSSAPPENIEVVLERLKAHSLFDATVSGADVRRGKPDPQVFLTAAARLRIPPERCVVVEDAAIGVEAAQAAGMATVGLASTGRTRESLAAADLVVDRLSELSPAVFERLIERRLAQVYGEEESTEWSELDDDDE